MPTIREGSRIVDDIAYLEANARTGIPIRNSYPVYGSFLLMVATIQAVSNRDWLASNALKSRHAAAGSVPVPLFETGSKSFGYIECVAMLVGGGKQSILPE